MSASDRILRGFVIGAAALGLALLSLPLFALFLRVPLADLPARLTQKPLLDALWVSLTSTAAATLLSLLLGLPMAWILARVPFPGKSVVRALVTLPMVLPPIVGGIALLAVFGRRGLLGSALESAAGITIPFSFGAVVLAAAFVAMPFFVLTAESGLRAVDARYEEAAASLGASPARRFLRITLPLAAPSIRSGLAICFARALGEFGATVTFAGSVPGRTQTLPLAVYLAFESDPDAAVVQSLVLVAISAAILIALRDQWLPKN
ncbi:MAG: molybdate ABC transporter permease subunit [Planctomycetes bacterium]|nr:molybdate ABC transporter permease subunit [Planctomycetota bacterium]